MRKEEDELVIKEVKRRNILLSKVIYKGETWNFDMNLAPEEVIDSLMTMNF